MDFLVYLAYKVRSQDLGSRVIPVAVRSVTQDTGTMPPAQSDRLNTLGQHHHAGPLSMVPFFDAGAVDVLTSPITVERAQSLPSHVYRLNAERLRRQSSAFLPPQGKKTSWVGTKEGKSYTQIKEVMVCELMDHIVNPDREELPLDPS